MTARIGTFIKTGSPQIVEVLGLTGLDLAVVDAEHAPFDRSTLDLMMMGARAANLPLFVRIPDDSAATILQVLDVGAAGLIVPHVDTPEQAQAVVRRARFENGERGFSNAGRFGRFGTTTIPEAVSLGDQAEIICQIESPLAAANADAIAATEGVAGLLVGRADLALSMGLRSTTDPEVMKLTRETLAAARRHGKCAGIVMGDIAESPGWRDAGADFFLVAHDWGFLRQAVADAVKRGRALINPEKSE